jgi:hypothetical protein
MPKKLCFPGLKVKILVQTSKLFHTYYLRQADGAALTNTIPTSEILTPNNTQ